MLKRILSELSLPVPPQLQGGAGSSRIATRVRGPAAALAPRLPPKQGGGLPYTIPPQRHTHRAEGAVGAHDTFQSQGSYPKGQPITPRRVLRPPEPGAEAQPLQYRTWAQQGVRAAHSRPSSVSPSLSPSPAPSLP